LSLCITHRKDTTFFTIQKKTYLCKKLFNIMAATTTKKTVKRTTAKATVKAVASKKLSKAGRWMRAHPDRRHDVIIYDQSILYG
jgi:hypothetical protein